MKSCRGGKVELSIHSRRSIPTFWAAYEEACTTQPSNSAIMSRNHELQLYRKHTPCRSDLYEHITSNSCCLTHSALMIECHKFKVKKKKLSIFLYLFCCFIYKLFTPCVIQPSSSPRKSALKDHQQPGREGKKRRSTLEIRSRDKPAH